MMLCLACMIEKEDNEFKISKALKKRLVENVQWCNKCQKDYLKTIKKKLPIIIDKTENEVSFK